MSIVNKKDIRKLLAKDNIFAGIHKQYGPPPNWNRPQGFVSLVKIILEQQVSLASAQAHFDKLNGYVAPITPWKIMQLSDEEMRNCQVSRQKTKYLRELATVLLDKRLVLETLEGLPEPEVRRQLTAVKGIGDWTADIYLLFCLQEKDIFPPGDIAVMKSAKELTGLTEREAIIERALTWQPYRSLATYFLWHHYLCKRNRKST